ncbi:beta-1,3-galactosyltransferase 1-like isoform 2-T2 [Anomaloglossus baeobatrachus]|uniref:beta-1,3-galactosyltransferase 1-like isoform X2 n=1 Tax=Anomaloglossus baeobatrachus TaxID=238106 RepID=UPI003F502269
MASVLRGDKRDGIDSEDVTYKDGVFKRIEVKNCNMNYFRKAFFKQSHCSKKTVKLQLFFILVLLTLTLLILSNSIWYALSLVSPGHLQSGIFKLSWNFQKNDTGKVNDFNIEQSQNESRNPSSTTITMAKMADNVDKTQYEYIINEPDKCKEHVPFLVLLITVQRWQLKARMAIRKTWGREDFLPGVNILRLFFLGKDPNMNNEEENALLEESQVFHDIIQQDYLDTYRNLTIKVLMGLNWITTYCPHALYIMKTDSDMFVNTDNLVNKLLQPNQTARKDYFTGCLMVNGSPIRNVNSKWYVSPDEYPEEKYPSFCSGTGYVLSGDLSHKIIKIFPNVKWVHLEDVFIGLCLDKLGVEPVSSPPNSEFNNWRVMYSGCKYHNIVTSHEMSPIEIQYYWGKLQDSKRHCL